jgi:hypothetical protein
VILSFDIGAACLQRKFGSMWNNTPRGAVKKSRH